MRSSNRVGRALAIGSALLVLSGCSSWQPIRPVPSGAPGQAPLPERVRVILAGERVVFVEQPRIVGDSLRGVCERVPATLAGLVTTGSTRDTCAIALRDVEAIEDHRHPGTAPGALLVATTLVLLAAFAFGTAISGSN
jgi:hypothetical protein